MAKTDKIRVGIAGCRGRMGAALVGELQSAAWPALALAGGTVEDKAASTDAFFITAKPEELFTRSDAVIDFTSPEAALQHAALAARHGTGLVIGTTGLTEAHEKELRTAAKSCAIVYAANMSVGVNLLLALVEQAAARLGPEWDIEIAETHHHHKKDSPSGTALALGHAARTGRGGGDFVTDRDGIRKPGTIGYAVQRGGDVVGEHTVGFYGAGERLALTHIATDRAIFARGALRAAQWIAGKPPGLYGMRDVLKL